MHPVQPFTYDAVVEQQERLRASASVEVSQAAAASPRACVIRFCASPSAWGGRLTLARLLGAAH